MKELEQRPYTLFRVFIVVDFELVFGHRVCPKTFFFFFFFFHAFVQCLENIMKISEESFKT